MKFDLSYIIKNNMQYLALKDRLEKKGKKLPETSIDSCRINTINRICEACKYWEIRRMILSNICGEQFKNLNFNVLVHRKDQYKDLLNRNLFKTYADLMNVTMLDRMMYRLDTCSPPYQVYFVYCYIYGNNPVFIKNADDLWLDFLSEFVYDDWEERFNREVTLHE